MAIRTNKPASPSKPEAAETHAAVPSVPKRVGRPRSTAKPVPASAPAMPARTATPASAPVSELTPEAATSAAIAPAINTQKAVPIAAAIEGSKTMNDTVTKAQDTAKKFTADAGQKVQALFGDASERAKASYEKGVKLTEEFSEFQKGNVEAFVESGKLAAKAAESLGQEAADYARKSFEHSTAAFKTFAGAKSPTELFKLQSDYVKSYFESAVAESTKVTEAWLKLAGDVAQPISNRMAVAVEKAKATAAF